MQKICLYAKNICLIVRIRIMPRLLIFSILSIHLLLSEILSQANIKFNHLTVEDGLSQSSITCILQDRQGFMWFGTQDGLNRYDGYTFKIFKNDATDSTSLSDNFIFSIIEDQSGSNYLFLNVLCMYAIYMLVGRISG